MYFQWNENYGKNKKYGKKKHDRFESYQETAKCANSALNFREVYTVRMYITVLQ